MNAAPNPADPSLPPASPAISAAADRARAELHEEIERVRRGVEEMLAEQDEPINADLRRELDSIREETRLYVKKRVRKTEKKLERSIDKIDAPHPGTLEPASTRSRPTAKPPSTASTATPSACSTACCRRSGRSRIC